MPMNIQEAYRTPNRLDQKRNSSQPIIIRTTNALNKHRILKAVREKGHNIKRKAYQNYTRLFTRDYEARRAWTDVMQTLREHKCQPRLLYPAKLSLPEMEKTKYSTTKLKSHIIFP